ncbi:hypothetical protein HK103_003806 [Boothiomyces macroporosus]|uniref:Uncharacterized protein n=1 Tax=Boothiomyces macroporosus TaxID=261099 RepID=A0AAD5UR07_9FUNG|nr:hypothetical protein HK103_003806 [Boothiomyces macroporosus]
MFNQRLEISKQRLDAGFNRKSKIKFKSKIPKILFYLLSYFLPLELRISFALFIIIMDLVQLKLEKIILFSLSLLTPDYSPFYLLLFIKRRYKPKVDEKTRLMDLFKDLNLNEKWFQ